MTVTRVVKKAVSRVFNMTIAHVVNTTRTHVANTTPYFMQPDESLLFSQYQARAAVAILAADPLY
jgi:hypothetical protein